jgi:hypothetical protein
MEQLLTKLQEHQAEIVLEIVQLLTKLELQQTSIE